MSNIAQKLRELADDKELLYNVPRRKIEDVLIELRDSGLSILGRNNGLVVKYKDGSSSDIIRMTIEDALRIGLLALAEEMDKEKE